MAFRITKYDPALRDLNGAYQRDDWTSLGDVGRHFHDGCLTVARYLEAENAYVDAARYFMNACGLHSMRVSYLEKYDLPMLEKSMFQDAQEWSKPISVGTVLSGDLLEKMMRACLREACFAKLEGPYGSYIHIGPDFYMFVGADRDEGMVDRKKFPPSLFVEDMPSPLIGSED